MSKINHWAIRNGEGYILELIVRDGSMAKNETFRFNTKDKKTMARVLRTIDEKYGIKLTPEKINKEKDKDLSWLDKSDFF